MKKQTVELSIEIKDEAIREQLIAELTEAGFDGFLEEEEYLKAYTILSIASDRGENSMYLEILEKYDVSFITTVIEEENWNALWEKNFDSICIENFVGIRAGFHKPILDVEHELVITPKMSFGTGHHATTYSVIQLMRDIDCKGKTVYDFGTGTGVLAILAEKLGAQKVVATDNDPWCISNATENIAVNNCTKIEVRLVTEVGKDEQYDIVIANINRNIIEANQNALSEQLLPGGTLILSGLLEADELDIINLFISKGLAHNRTLRKTGWIVIHLTMS